jgi:hypothetical protein
VAGDVAGHEVGRELDAPEDAAKTVSEGKDEVRFAKSGLAFEENMSACDESHEDLIHDRVLAKENGAELLMHRAEQRGTGGKVVGGR